jgi:hypothetical protein
MEDGEDGGQSVSRETPLPVSHEKWESIINEIGYRAGRYGAHKTGFS